MKKKTQEKIRRIEAMTDAEMRQEMTEIITKDVMRFVEIVTRKRVGLFVDTIYEGIKNETKS